MSGTQDRIDSGTGKVARRNRASRNCDSYASSKKGAEPKYRELHCCAADNEVDLIVVEAESILSRSGDYHCLLDGSDLFLNTK
jgi:hypothetical protein